MKRLSPWLILFLLVAQESVSRQMTNASGEFYKIDSLLVEGHYDETQMILTLLSSSSASSHNEILNQYRNLLVRLRSIRVLPDSLVKDAAAAGELYHERFSQLNAGLNAETCYKQFVTSMSQASFSTAYERYFLAEFLRQRHIAAEKERLRSNLAQAKDLFAHGKLDLALGMIEMFENETGTIAFNVVEQELEESYTSLRRQIDSEKVRLRYESKRVQLDKTLYFSIARGVDPYFEISNSDLFYYNPSMPSTQFVINEGPAISKSIFELSGEAGYFLSNAFVLGLRYVTGTASSSNAVLDRNRFTRRFGVRIDVRNASLFLRFYLDNKTGFRSFAGVSGGSNLRKASPLVVEGDANALLFVEDRKVGSVFEAELGQEYIPSTEFPIVIAAHLRGAYSTNNGIFPRVSVHVGLRIGVAL